MGRAPCCDKIGVKKGPWTPEEDRKLIAYVECNGHGSWRALPKLAGLSRCGKSCRLRWTNYLRPDIKRGNFSFEEEQTIIQLHALLGNRWSNIATHLPGRTDNEIKNYWNTHLRKRLLQMGIDPVTHLHKIDVYDSLSSANVSISSTISHMAQWESARLEAEARLAANYLKMARPQPVVDANSSYVSPQILMRLLGREAAAQQSMRTDPNQAARPFAWGMHLTGTMELNRNWQQSGLQAQSAFASSPEFSVPNHPSRVVAASPLSCLPDISSQSLQQGASFKLEGLEHMEATSSALSCSFVDTQTLPFFENTTELDLVQPPSNKSSDFSCNGLTVQAASDLFRQSNCNNLISTTIHDVVESSCPQRTPFLWTEDQLFSTEAPDPAAAQSVPVAGVAANSPSSFNTSCCGSSDMSACEAGSSTPRSLLDVVHQANATAAPVPSTPLNLPASLPLSEEKDYWSSVLKLVGVALPRLQSDGALNE